MPVALRSAAFTRVVATCLLAGGLLACDPAPPPATTRSEGLATTPLAVKLAQPGCMQDCARFEANWLQFPTAPDLEQQLLRDQGVVWKGSAKASLDFAATDFMADAEARWDNQLRLTQLSSALPPVTVLEALSYSFTGGAHGQSVLSFYNWDQRTRKLVGLRDWLLPGQEKVFWALVRDAHRRWAERSGEPSMIDSGWPFVVSQNMALLADGLGVRYNAYEIGPYAEGAPLLRVPYARLQGVFKPEWLPAR